MIADSVNRTATEALLKMMNKTFGRRNYHKFIRLESLVKITIMCIKKDRRKIIDKYCTEFYS